MKKFGKYILIVLFFYAAGVAASVLLDGTDIATGLTSLWALAAAGMALLCCLLFGKPKKEEKKSFAVGKTQAGDKVSQYYDAKWVSEKDLKTNPKYNFNTYATLPSVKKSGIVIRNEVKNGHLEVNMYDPIHTLVIGTTGSGKTANVLSPAIRILAHTGQKPCFVITDPKGELYAKHSKQLRKEGYRILTLDLRKPFASTRWNPMGNAYDLYHRALDIEQEVKIHNGGKPAQFKLHETSNYKGEKTWYEWNGYAYGDRAQLVSDLKAKKQELIDTAFNELREIAASVCPVEDKQNPSWERGAQDLLYGIMIAMLEDSENPELGMTREKFNPYNLAKIATLRDDDADNPYGTLRDYCSGRDKFSKVPSLTSTAINNAPGTTRSYMGILYTHIAVFQDTGICYATAQSDMKFDDFVEQPTVLFIKVPDEKESRHCIATMCISQLYQKLVSIASEYPDLALPRYVYFLLDEFANLPKIEKMASLITVARSRKIFFEMVIQSYSQLDSKYGEQDAKTIIGNCPIQIYIGTDDQKTKEEFSKMCGEQSLELEQTTESKSDKKDQGKSTTTSKQVVTRPLIGPYELGQLPQGTCIVKIFQNDPIKTPFTAYYKTPEFDTTILEDEYFPSRPFDEEAIYYDVKNRNKIILKPKGGFDPFDF